MNHHFLSRGLLALLAFLLPGVARGVASPRPIASRDINGLSRMVNLPRRPLHALWKEQKIGDGSFGPSDTRLIAVLVFSPHDLASIEKSAARRSPTRDGFIDVQTWFPDAMRKRAIKESAGKLTRNLRLRARQLDAGDFAKLSLQNGALLRVPGTNTCVLSLFTT